MTLSTKAIKSLISTDTLSKRNGVFTARRGFFYTNGRTSQDFADSIKIKLKANGLQVRIIEDGEVWKAFKGGASVANQSHWYVKFSVEQGE